MLFVFWEALPVICERNKMHRLNNKLVKTFITVSLGLALTACGGSDSKTTPDPDPDPVVNSAPVISSTGVNTVEAGSAYSYTLAASDADGDALTLSAGSLPAWLSFDGSNGTLSGTPAENDAGDHAITLTVSDGTDEVTQSFTITVTVPVNNAPMITSTSIDAATSGNAYSYTLTATDADSDTLTMSATTIPTWLAFDAATGILSGTPADGDEGDNAVVLAVSDGTDEVTQSFTITVTVPVAVNNAPVITSAGVANATVDVVYSYTLTATDADNDTLTMSAAIPAELSWLSFDANTGILSGTPASGDIGAYEITLTVNDGTEDVTQTFTITVADVVVANEVVDFEAAVDSYVFNNFDGGVSTVIANPQVNGINVSAQVVQMQKFAGQTWGGSTLTLPNGLNVTAGNHSFTMKVYSERSVPVLFKLESLGKPEVSVTHGGTGWEELTFDFALIDGVLNDITVIFDLGINGDADANAADWTFYYDEIVLPKSGDDEEEGGSTTVTDFEAAIDSYAFNNFDGGVSTVIANPQSSDINVSAQVVQMQKFAGQVWGGSTYTLETPVVIAEGSNNFTMKVWSQRAVPVLFKLEGYNLEQSANHTGSGWEELSFDFTLTSDTLSMITVIFDLGINGDADANAADWTFYYDDITTPATEVPVDNSFVAVGTPYDFEAGGLGSDFAWTVFENETNDPLEFVANPSSDSVNDSAIVAKMTAKQAGQPWAGTETTSANTTPFTMDATNSIVKIMVYKSVISDVGMKFSVGAAAQPELKVANTKINEWEELTFDFSGRIGLAETINIDSVIVFPDFDARAQDNVVYFDNITFGHNE